MKNGEDFGKIDRDGETLAEDEPAKEKKKFFLGAL